MTLPHRRIGLAIGFATIAVLVSTFVSSGPATADSATLGQDVSAYQGDVDWGAQYNAGSRFAYVKATEGTYYTNEDFASQYEGSYYAGIIHGAYHFATPNTTDGATQADYFVDNGGGWSPDGMTLPGALDIEYNPYGDECYDLSQSAMVDWVSAFVNEYYNRTGRWAVIYSTTDWWTTCTGNYSGFWANDPLWLASYSSSPGTLPAGASYWSFWQYADAGGMAGDQDEWNGDTSSLHNMVCAGQC